MRFSKAELLLLAGYRKPAPTPEQRVAQADLIAAEREQFARMGGPVPREAAPAPTWYVPDGRRLPDERGQRATAADVRRELDRARKAKGMRAA